MSIGKFLLWAIVFQFIGNLYGSISFAQILCVIFCSIPLTKKLKIMGALKDNHISRMNFRTITLHLLLGVVVFTFLFMFGNIAMIWGFLGGFVIVLFISIKKVGMTDTNIDDYYRVHLLHIDFDVIEENNVGNGVISNNYKGQSTCIFPDGSEYVGEIKHSKPDGQGTITNTNGYKYVGKWKNGKQNGQGTAIFPEGNKYVGEFKDNMFNGKGTYTFADGEKYIGKFKDDNYISDKIFDHLLFRKINNFLGFLKFMFSGRK